MTQNEWLKYGFDNGFCSPPICDIHDGIPMTKLEAEEIENGNDPCINAVRIYDNLQMKRDVETNSYHAVWRASNLGWIVK